MMSRQLMLLTHWLGWGALANNIRGRLLNVLGFPIGKDSALGYKIDIMGPDTRLTLGNHVFINHFVKFACEQRSIKVGDFCSIGPFVTFGRLDDTNEAEIVVDDHVWIGANATIDAGVRVGRGAVVGANSLVTQDVPENALVVGSPARVIRYLNNASR
jgi:acetyltransferase-like isoleucine patch superfamily enzyme